MPLPPPVTMMVWPLKRSGLKTDWYGIVFSESIGPGQAVALSKLVHYIMIWCILFRKRFAARPDRRAEAEELEQPACYGHPHRPVTSCCRGDE